MKRGTGEVFGRGIGFPPRIGADGRVAWSEGPANVRENLRIILSTQAGERQRWPGFGAGLQRFLFEPNNAGTRAAIAQAVEQAVQAWEPRVRLESVTVNADERDARVAAVQLSYRLVADESRERVAVSVQLGG